MTFHIRPFISCPNPKAALKYDRLNSKPQREKMATVKKQTLTTPQTSSTIVNIMINNNAQTQKICLYEQSRDERIKQNLEKMQKLGLKDLSLTVKSLALPISRRRRNPSTKETPLKPSGPTRRSSRLQNGTPVSYSEVVLTKKGISLDDEEDNIKLELGSQPEIYTEEHKKWLGHTEKSWTLFVDGYGRDGRRIYDQVIGKTCHQCRQKTLGLHTNCCKCNLVQGQFCGDCLYMRYGEHVVESMENPDWICPVCRGICNCSLCRHAKGWPATGALYRKISKLGFKSVAHYLIETHQRPDNVEKTPSSAKRPLHFSDTETLSAVSLNITNDEVVLSKPHEEIEKCLDTTLSIKGLVKVQENNDLTERTDKSNVNQMTAVGKENVKRKKMTPARVVEQNTNSIAARLKQRRRLTETNQALMVI